MSNTKIRVSGLTSKEEAIQALRDWLEDNPGMRNLGPKNYVLETVKVDSGTAYRTCVLVPEELLGRLEPAPPTVLEE